MEPARSTAPFNRKITVADGNNIIAILDMNSINSQYQIFEQDYLVTFQAVLEDLKVTVGLSGLAEADWPNVNALMNQAEQQAENSRVQTEGQKISLGLYIAIGNGPWQYESEVVLQNRGGSETHVPILVPYLSSNETLLMSGNFKLGVKIEPKWNQPLKVNDYLIIKGTWRQVVSFSKKKDDDLEAFEARLATLELALTDRITNVLPGMLLGRNVGTGVIQQIPQSQFATPAQIATAINNLVAASPGTLDTLNELASALGNDANFAATVINQLATKVGLADNQSIGGIKIFTESIQVGASARGYIKLSPGSAETAGYLEIYRSDGVNRLGYIGYDNNNIWYQAEGTARHIFAGPISLLSLPTSSSGLPVGALWRNGNVINVV